MRAHGLRGGGHFFVARIQPPEQDIFLHRAVNRNGSCSTMPICLRSDC
jgi:hypothetical protein